MNAMAGWQHTSIYVQLLVAMPSCVTRRSQTYWTCASRALLWVGVRTAVTGQLQSGTVGEAAATPQALLQDLINAVCLTVWEWCEKRSNISIPCNYLLYCVITCNCILLRKCCMYGILLKLFYSSLILFLPVFLV